MKRLFSLLFLVIFMASIVAVSSPLKASAQTPINNSLVAPFKIMSVTNNDGTLNSDTDCTSSSAANPFAWIVCPIVSVLGSVLDTTYNELIYPLLVVPPIPLPGQSDTNNKKSIYFETYQIWSNFRLIGNVVLVIVLLVVVFGESIGGGLIDAYTVRKILPRLLIGAILINISIYIVAFAIDVTNVVGAGLGNLIQSPFPADAKQLNFNNQSILSGGGAANYIKGDIAIVGSFVALGAAVALFEWTLLAVILVPTILAFFITVIVLMLRSGLIMLLVYTAPVAFALWCLPNTEQYFKKWWSLLFKILLIFPIISLLFALGNITSFTVSRAIPDQTLGQFLKVIAIFVPFYMIPFTFQFAGGVIAGAAGMLNKRVSRPAMGAATGAAGRRGRTNLGRAASGSLLGGTAFDRMTRGMGSAIDRRTAGLASGVRGRFGAGQAGRDAIEERQNNAARRRAQEDDMQDLGMNTRGAAVMAASRGTRAGARDFVERAIREEEQRTRERTGGPLTAQQTADIRNNWEAGLAAAERTGINDGNARAAMQMGASAQGFSESDLSANFVNQQVADSANAVSAGSGQGLVQGFRFNARQNGELLIGNGGDINNLLRRHNAAAIISSNPDSIRSTIDELHQTGNRAVLEALRDEANAERSGASEITKQNLEAAINNLGNNAWRAR